MVATSGGGSAGSVYVEIRARMDSLERDLAAARARLGQFDRQMSAGQRGTARLAAELGVAGAVGVKQLEKLTLSGKKAEAAFAGIERAARMGGVGTKGYSEALGQAYGIQQKMTNEQAAAIRQYETLTAKTELLSKGRGREAAQLVAVRRAGTTVDTEYGRAIAALSGNLYDLEKQQDKANESGRNLVATLTRRFVVGFAVTQIRSLVSAVWNLNSEMAKVGDIGRLTGTGGQQIQGLQSIAAVKGLDSGKFLDDMTNFARQVSLAKIGVGDLAMLLGQTGKPVTDVADAFFRVADLVKNAKTEMAKLSILQQAGLPATYQFVNLMEQGSSAIKAASAATTKFTESQLKEAKELAEQFNSIVDAATRLAKLGVVKVFGLDWSAEDKLMEQLRKEEEARPKITVTRGVRATPTIDVAEERLKIQRELQLLSLYGATTTAAEARRQVELQMKDAGLQLLSVDRERVEVLKQLAYESNLGITQIKASADAHRVEAETIGMTVGEAAAYSAAQTVVNEKRRLGIELSGSAVDAIKREADALGQAAQAADDMRFRLDAFKGMFVGFNQELRSGASIWEAFKKSGLNALNRISDKLAEMAAAKVFSAAFGGTSSGFGLFGGGAPSTGSGLGAGVGDVPLLTFGAPSGAARGNVFDRGNIIPFARGGIVAIPTLFPMARGAGLMGEAGPEAVIPLARGRDGRLGVRGGASVSVTVNNYAGDETETRQSRRSGPSGEEVVIDIVKRAFASGEFDAQNAGRFGVRPRKVR